MASMQFHAWKHMIRMIPYDSMHGTMTYRPSMQFHGWNHMIPYIEVHGTISFHAWKGMERKAKIRNSQNFKFSLYLRVTFRKQLENNWI